MSEILPWLFLGDRDDASNICFLRRHKIECIVNCTNDLPFYFKNARHPYTFQYIKCPVNDDLTMKSGKRMSQILPDVVKTLKDNAMNLRPTLVHCKMGRQRSATVVAAYLLYIKRFDRVEDAIKFIQDRRCYSFYPGANFGKELKDFYRKLSWCL